MADVESLARQVARHDEQVATLTRLIARLRGVALLHNQALAALAAVTARAVETSEEGRG